MPDIVADYYRSLAKAVGALAHNTPETRAELYQRGRVALAQRLRAAQPPPSEGDIALHKTALEHSIRLVELAAGYYRHLAKAVGALAHNTPEARAELYDRGRRAMADRLTTARPPLSEREIAIHKTALEESIRRIQAENTVPSAIDRDSAAAPAAEPLPSRETAPLATGGESRVSGEGGFRLPAGLMLIVLMALVITSMSLHNAGADYARIKEVVEFVWLGLLAGLLIYFVYVVVRRRRRLHDAGIQRRRVAALAVSPSGNDTRQQGRLRLYEEAVQKLNDSSLLWAYWLPEHADEAKKYVLSELERRGYSGDQAQRWSPPASQLTVPPTVERPVPVNKYSLLVLMRRAGWVLFQIISLAGLALFGFALVDRQNIDPALGISGVAAMIGLLLLLIASCMAFSVQDRAQRILLLRPFGEKKMTSTLRRFVRKNLGPAGYTFTLSDRNYKPSFVDSKVFRILSGGFETVFQFAVGSIFANSHRIAAVKNDKTFFRSCRALTQKFTLSYWSFITSGQAFNIRTTDAFWQLCIQMLMHSCDVVVVDLSRVKAGTAWEINELHERDLRARCMFVVSEDNKAEIGEVLAQHFSRHAPPPVYVYRRNGQLLDKPQFDAELKHRIELALVQA